MLYLPLSLVTVDKVGTTVMLSPFSLVTLGQGWNNSHALLPRFLLFLVGTTAMLLFVFCCYWWQSWNNSHALSPRLSLVTVDRWNNSHALLLVFCCYWWQSWNNSHAFSCLVTKLKRFLVVTGDKVGTTVMLYLPVFSCYWWQSWNNSHALSPRFLLTVCLLLYFLVTKLEQ